MITSANDVYDFVAQLKIDAEKCGDTDLGRKLDEALHLGSSSLEILGAIRKALIENSDEVKALRGSVGCQQAAQVIAFVDKTFGR